MNVVKKPYNMEKYKEELKAKRWEIFKQNPQFHSPKTPNHRYSELIDEIIRESFHRACPEVLSSSISLIALGSYGRKELAPYSDIDLLILHNFRNHKELSTIIEKILYPLWDLGLEIGCSSRSVSECLTMAKDDLQIKTSIIDCRFLDGDYESFRKFYELFTKNILYKDVKRFASGIASEVFERWRRYETPDYILEPNLKEGKGGIRDFHIGCWLNRAKYQTDRLEFIIIPHHLKSLDQSFQFLLCLRNQIHLLNQRRQDELSFEFQEKIAPFLGFSDGSQGIEEMMRQYHMASQKISSFVHNTVDRILLDSSFLKKFFNIKKKIDSNFIIKGRNLSILNPSIFKEDPTQLMVLFQYYQLHDVEIDLYTEEKIKEKIAFIDEHFTDSEIVSQIFISILKRGKRVTRTLRKMHELGFLVHLIPEFSEIVGKTHYDLYHIHPIDVHSIMAVEELEKLKEGYYEKEFPLLSSLIREIEAPEIIFLSALLHDIGKAREGDHSVTGSKMVYEIGQRLRLGQKDIELLSSLVRNHLLMISVALKRDLKDEQAILRFVSEIGSLPLLKMLYLLTFADLKSVGPETWTHWKDTLLMELFIKASHILEKGYILPFFKKEMILAELKEFLPASVFSEYCEYLSDRYLSCYPLQRIIKHIQMACNLKEGPVVIENEINNDSQAIVTVCTKDRYGLFSKIAGAFSLNHLNILEAQIHTWENGIALDTFFIEDRTKDIERRLNKFKRDLGEIINDRIHLKNLIIQSRSLKDIKPKVSPIAKPEIKINNEESDFYTIIEITGEDRSGILYELTQTLTDHGCNIQFAKISTIGNRILDIFYIQDEWGEKITGQYKLEHMIKSLLACLTPLQNQ